MMMMMMMTFSSFVMSQFPDPKGSVSRVLCYIVSPILVKGEKSLITLFLLHGARPRRVIRMEFACERHISHCIETLWLFYFNYCIYVLSTLYAFTNWTPLVYTFVTYMFDWNVINESRFVSEPWGVLWVAIRPFLGLSWWDPEKTKTSLSSVAQICITSWKIHEGKSQRNEDCFKGMSWNRFPIYQGRFFFSGDFHAPLTYSP